MRIFVLLFVFISSIFASNLLTYNIYERSDRVDIMLSFDSPYEGRISQKRGENITVLTLDDLSYDKLIEKNINSTIIQSASIQPEKNSIKITLKSDKNIAVIASKTVDGFGLRVRAKPIVIKNNSALTKSTTTSVATPQDTKVATIIGENTEEIVDSRYLSVIAVLFVMLLFMMWIKNRVQNKNTSLKKEKKSSWLFSPSFKNSSNKEINVLHKKAIDQQNSVLLLEFEGKKYLVMSGNSNVLLDKFSGNEIEDNNEFEKAFEENRKKLDDYLKLQDNGMDSYKSKVSGDFKAHLESY